MGNPSIPDTLGAKKMAPIIRGVFITGCLGRVLCAHFKGLETRHFAVTCHSLIPWLPLLQNANIETARGQGKPDIFSHMTMM